MSVTGVTEESKECWKCSFSRRLQINQGLRSGLPLETQIINSFANKRAAADAARLLLENTYDPRQEPGERTKLPRLNPAIEEKGLLSQESVQAHEDTHFNHYQLFADQGWADVERHPDFKKMFKVKATGNANALNACETNATHIKDMWFKAFTIRMQKFPAKGKPYPAPDRDSTTWPEQRMDTYAYPAQADNLRQLGRSIKAEWKL